MFYEKRRYDSNWIRMRFSEIIKQKNTTYIQQIYKLMMLKKITLQYYVSKDIYYHMKKRLDSFRNESVKNLWHYISRIQSM